MIPYRLINGVAFFVRTDPQTGILFFMAMPFDSLFVFR